MTAQLLSLTPEVREAVKDLRSIREKQATDQTRQPHEWAAALNSAGHAVANLARQRQGKDVLA